MDNKTKIKLNIIRILCIISLLVSFISIRNTFAKYYERINTNYDINIKKWLIEVNDIDIIEQNNFSQIVTPVYVTNAHTSQNVLVPTSQIYFEMEIDYTNVDLNFEMDFDLEPVGEEGNQLLDLLFLKAVKVNENETETEGELPYLIDISSGTPGNKVITLRVYYEWHDGINQVMSDEDDTEFIGEEQSGNSHAITRYNATVVFSQYIEEEGG